MSNKAATIPDRAALTDMVCDYMHDHHRAWTIETLLLHPLKAQQMGVRILRKLGRKVSEEGVTQVLRAALSSRKRGELRRDRY